jgi:CRP-like cAMP-binding protein
VERRPPAARGPCTWGHVFCRRIALGSGRLSAEELLFDPVDLNAVRAALGCAPELSERILGLGRVRLYAAGAHLLRQGDRPSALYLIILGRCHALVYGVDGQMVLLHELGPGDLFGALGGLDAVEEDADVVAVEEVRSFLLEAGVLVGLAERHGCIGLALSRILLKRLRATSTRMFERAALSASGRVCAELLRRARAGEGLAIRPPPVLAELGMQVGTTRETVSRTVNALERRGILRREPDALVVVAPGRLEAEIL